MRLQKHHITQNTINLVFLPICILIMYLSFTHSSQSYYQLKLMLTAGVTYMILSTIHHYFDKSLTFEVVFEYILIGTIAILAVLMFIY